MTTDIRMSIYEYQCAGAAVEEVLTQPSTTAGFRENLQKAQTNLNEEFAALRRELDNLGWEDYIIRGPVYSKLGEMADLLNRVNESFGAQELELGRKISALLPGFWQYVNVLLGFKSGNVNVLANTAKRLLLTEQKEFDVYNDHLAVRAVLPHLLSLCSNLQQRTFEALEIANNFLFSMFSVSTQSESSKLHKSALTCAWFVYVSVVKTAQVGNLSEPEMTRRVKALGEEFSSQMGLFSRQIENLTLSEINSLDESMSKHWTNEAFQVVWGETVQTPFSRASTYLNWMRLYLLHSQHARIAWFGRLIHLGDIFYEMFASLISGAQEIMIENQKHRNSFADLWRTAQDLGYQDLDQICKDMIAVKAQFLEKTAYEENLAETFNVTPLRKLASVLASLTFGEECDQQTLEDVYLYHTGYANLIRHNNAYDLVARHIELRMLRELFNSGNAAQISNDIESLRDLTKRRQKLAQRLETRAERVKELIRDEWERSEVVFNVLIQQFEEFIEEDESLSARFSQKAVEQVVKATSSLKVAADISDDFQKTIVEFLLITKELEDNNEKIRKLKTRLQKVAELNETGGKDFVWYVEGGTLLIMLGVGAYFFIDNIQDILDYSVEQSGWWSYMPGFIQSFGTVRFRDVLSVSKWLGHVQNVVSGNPLAALGSVWMFRKMFPLAVFTAKTTKGIVNSVWSACNIVTVSLLEPIVRYKHTSLRQTFTRQSEIFKAVLNDSYQEGMDMITESLQIGSRRGYQMLSTIAQTGFHTASGNYAAAAGTVTLAALKEQEQPSYGQILPTEKQKLLLQNQSGESIEDYKQVSAFFSRTIEEKAKEKEQKELIEYRTRLKIEKEKEEEEEGEEEEEEEDMLMLTWDEVSTGKPQIEEVE